MCKHVWQCFRRMACFSAFVLFLSGLQAAETPDYWAQHNKDGHWRNASERSLQGSLQMRWAQSMTLSAAGGLSLGKLAQRANNFSVRDGKILLVVPPSPAVYARYGMYSLSTGQLICSAVGQHAYGGGIMSGAGMMDSDTKDGLITQYWQSDGKLYTASGGDGAHSRCFNPYTGEHISNPRLAGGPNGAAYFAMTNSSGLFAKGGSQGHSPYDNGSFGLLDSAGVPVSGIGGGSSLKCYASAVVDGQRAYMFNVVDKSTSLGKGVQIGAFNVPSKQNVWNYSSSSESFLCFGSNHGGGAPRAICLGEDGRLYYFGYTPTTGPTNLVLKGVKTSDGTSDLTVNVAFSPASEAPYAATSNQQMLPQIATRANYVAVFQPQQTGVNGHLYCFDTSARTLLWRHDFPSGYFAVNTSTGLNSPEEAKEQAVQMTIAGASAYVVAPYADSGNLKVRVERFALADGTRTTTSLSPTAAGSPINVGNAGTLAMRDVAAVDGALVCLIDYDLFKQALLVIEGNASPVLNFMPAAVISAPVIGTTQGVVAILTDYPVVKFITGETIAFSSAGSLSPHGGAITYAWNFGDGTTSADANPAHTYAAAGNAPRTTNYTVSLTVTDNNGNISNPATVTLPVRDVGATSVSSFVAEADSYVYSDSSNASRNFGSATTLEVRNGTRRWRSYLRFDAGSVNPDHLVSATLRLYLNSDITSYVDDCFLRVRRTTNAWAESTITWNNAPALGDIVGEKYFPNGLRRGPGYVDIPVTDYVKAEIAAGRKLDVALDGPQPATYHGFTISSREGSRPPQLLIRTGDPGYAAPQITVQPQDMVTCTDDPTAQLSLTATSETVAASELTYHWKMISGPTDSYLKFSPNHSNTANSTVLTVSTNVAGQSFTCVCAVYDGVRQTTSRVVTITTGNVRPVPVLAAAPLSGIASLTVQFDASASSVADGTIVSYLWDFGDGATSTAVSPAHTYSPAVGTVFPVSLTVTDNQGARAVATIAIPVFVGNGANSVPLQEGVGSYTGCRDVSLISANASANLGGETYIGSRLNAPNSLLAFDLSRTIPVNSTINSAKLYLQVISEADQYDATVLNYRLYHLTRPWVEGTGTFSPTISDGASRTMAEPGVPWTTAGGDYDAAVKATYTTPAASLVGTWVELDVKNLVTDWVTGAKPNYGLMLKADATRRDIDFASRNHADPNLRPKLVVDFTLNGTFINFPPVAEAGPFQNVAISPQGAGGATVTLDGGGSIDRDGSIVSSVWKEGAITLATGVTANVFLASGAVSGVHIITLTVTDAGGATASDSVTITIPNQAPTATVGADQIIWLPTALTLNGIGTDADGIVTYQWTKVIGPAATITSPSSATTTITGLSVGDYTFRLTVTDDLGKTATDDVAVSATDASSTFVRAVGYNNHGSLGDGTRTNRNLPVAIELYNVSMVSGGLHSLALKLNGTVVAWGYNLYGQLGDGTTTQRLTPTPVSGLTGVTAVSAGRVHSLAVKSDGSVQAWGYNSYGQLGNGTKTNRTSPVQVSRLTGVSAVSAGFYHSLAVKSDGTVWAWGSNSTGQLGDGTIAGRLSPVKVSGLTGVAAVSAGIYHSLAVKSDGTVWAWGQNTYGQLGDGTTTQRLTSVKVSGLTGVTAIDAGDYHGLAVKSDGTVQAWGYNWYGQLGDGSTTNRTTPVAVGNLSGETVTKIAAGVYHSLFVISSSGTSD